MGRGNFPVFCELVFYEDIGKKIHDCYPSFYQLYNVHMSTKFHYSQANNKGKG